MGFRELEVPRALTTWERAMLDALLAREFPGADVLRMQAASAVVGGVYEEPGDPTVGLVVAKEDAPRVAYSGVPIEAAAEDEGDEPVSILLHVLDGLLFELEVIRLDGRPIVRLPVPAELNDFFSPLRGATDAHS